MFIFHMKSQYKVFKMALPLKINAEAQADASSDDPICQNLIATQMHWKLDNWQTDMWKNINAFWPRSPSHEKGA